MRVLHQIGIEAIAVHIPRHFIDLGILASANDVDPAKYYLGLGGRRMAVVAPNEDPVTMAVGAAKALLDRYDIDRGNIGLLVVGTESGVDGAKPIASYVHGLLGLATDCRTFDTKHACYSGTAALRMASDWTTARAAVSRKKALVIATDIARYVVGSPGEPTQGAGAVALLIGDEPVVFALDPYPEAVFTEEVMDFWRPHYRSTALVHGEMSIDSYLKALERTYSTYELNSGLGWNDYDYFLFHVPFPKMAFKALRLLYEREASRNGNGNCKLPLDSTYEERTVPALWANMELGNIYSGSLYLSLAGLLERDDLSNEEARVGMFSYGSGCCAEYFSGRIGSDSSAWRGRIGIIQGLKQRIELGYHQYLQFSRASEAMAQEGSHVEWLAEAAGDERLVFSGIRNHQRVYDYCNRTPPAASNSARAQIEK